MTTGAVKKVVLYNAETGQQVELNGVQEISIADEVIAENTQKMVLDFDREIAMLCKAIDQTALLRLKLTAKSWAGLVPRVRIRKAFWPWKGRWSMRRWLKMTRIFLGCLFHVKGYSWFAPWVRDELYREDDEV